MKIVLFFVLFIALSGCAALEPRVVTTTVPVAVKCIETRIPKPLWATDTLPLHASLLDKVKALLAERLQRMAYEAELEAQVEACL